MPFQIGFFYLVICISSMSFHCSVAHFFLALNNIPLSVCISFFIHSPAEGPLGCIQDLAVMNKDAVNIHV